MDRGAAGVGGNAVATRARLARQESVGGELVRWDGRKTYVEAIPEPVDSQPAVSQIVDATVPTWSAGLGVSPFKVEASLWRLRDINGRRPNTDTLILYDGSSLTVNDGCRAERWFMSVATVGRIGTPNNMSNPIASSCPRWKWLFTDASLRVMPNYIIITLGKGARPLRAAEVSPRGAVRGRSDRCKWRN